MPSVDTKASRPLSPHLQIYRVTMTMAMSIVHRIAGAALYVGTLLFVWWTGMYLFVPSSWITWFTRS